MVQLANKTLVAFEQAVQHDGGNAFRMWLGRVLPHIGDAYRQESDPFRSHMGASGIGRECARAVWYDFNWFTIKQHTGTLLRLFNRGHLEEGRFIALMLAAGFQVIQQDAEGKQFKISECGGHYGGSGDGMFIGCPDLAPEQVALSEFKTHNKKSFETLAGKDWGKYIDFICGRSTTPVQFSGEGVRSAKFEHYVQMQQYMRKMGLASAVYIAVCKDNDQIYAELVPLDTELADRFLHRAIQIVPMRAPPDKISKVSSDFRCKFCDHRPVCQLGAPAPKNCRTCEFSVPDSADGQWWCTNEDRRVEMLFGPKPGLSEEGETYALTKQRQLLGCTKYVRNSKS